jgi:hypothetical protein
MEWEPKLVDKLNSEWISVPDQKTTLESMVVDFPGYLKLHLDEKNDLVNNNNSL